MHLLEGLGGEILRDALRLNVIKQVPNEVHFGEVPTPLFVLLIIRVYY